MPKNKFTRIQVDKDLDTYEQEQRAISANKKDLYTNYDRRSIDTNLNDPNVRQYIQEGTDNENSWYDSAWNRTKQFVMEDVPNFFTEDIPNAIRMINEKRAQGFISEKQEQLRRLKEEDKGLSLVSEYQDLVKEYQALATEQQTPSTIDEMQKIQQRLYELDDYFQSKEGRQNAAIRELMYDIKSDHLRGQDISQIISGNILYGMDSTPETVKGDNILQTVKNAASAVGTGIENAFSAVGNAIVGVGIAGGKLASSIGIGTDNPVAWDIARKQDDGYATSRALQALPDENPLIQRLYKGANIATDIESRDRKTRWEDNNRRLKEQYNLELDKYIEDFTNGNWKIPLSEDIKDALKWVAPSRQYEPNTGITINNVWDPEDVSQQWRENQEKYTGSIWHPLYMLPEIGSTLGMVEGMIETVGLNVAAEAAVRKLPSLIGGGPTKKAIQMAFAAGDIEKGVSLLKARSAAEVATSTKLGEAALRSAEIGTGIGITYGQRKHETNMEALQAVSSRLQKSLNDSDVDAEKVYNAILDYEAQRGVDVSRLSPTDLIGEAIARDIDTGDPVFEQNKKDAQKGIMKLINANNALALHDYLEVLPMLSYGEKALSYFGKTISGSAPVALTRPLFSRTAATQNVGRRNIAQFYKDVAANRALYAEEAARSAINPRYKSYYDTMFGAYDGAVESAVKRLANNKRLFGAMVLSRTAKFLEGKTKTLPYTMTMEGFEEGIQTTLQQRHEAGLYDNYQRGYDTFSITDVLDTPELAGNVVSAFFGLNGKGDDEIVKTTVIGAFVGSLFPLAGSAITNFSNNPNNNNFRNLITQLKNDRVATKLLSEDFDKIADEKRVRLFIEAFNRTGVNAARLTKSLNDIKSAVDTENGIINSDFVDGDIQLLDAAWYMYNNDYINKQLKERGIKKYSQEHKDIMTNGAIAIADARRSKQSTQEAVNKIVQLLEPNNNLVDELFDNKTTDERKEDIYRENPQLKNIVSTLLSSYEEYEASVYSKNQEYANINKKQKDEVINKTKNMSAKDLVELNVRGNDVVLDWVKSQLTQEGELNENSVYTKDYIKRKAIEMLSNEGYRKALINYLVSITPQLQNVELQSKPEYIKNYLNALNVHKQIKIAESIKKWIDDDAVRLSEIQALTGMDIDTNTIKGMSNGLDKLIQQLKEQADTYVETQNKSIKRENDSRKELGEDPLPLVTLDDVFVDDRANLVYDFEDEYNKWVRSFILNSSLKYAQDRVAAAYRDPRSIVPEELNVAIFGKDANSSFLFSDVDAYKKKKAAVDALPQADQKFSTVEEEDLGKMRESTSWKVIKHDLDRTKKERSRIVHPEHNILVESEDTNEPEPTEGVITSQQEKERDIDEQVQEDEELEKLLSEASGAADQVEVATMHKDPKELQRERAIQERARKKSEESKKAEVEDNNKEDDKHPHSDQNKQEEKPNTAQPAVEPTIIPKRPEAPNNNATVSDQIGDPIVIDGKNYYKYAITTYGPNYNSTEFVIADVNGNIIKNSPYAFVTQVPSGYKIDVSKLTSDEIGSIGNIQITRIVHANDGRSAIQTNIGTLSLIKDDPGQPHEVIPVDTDVLEKIKSAEADPAFKSKPLLTKTEDGITIVSIETIYKLSTGDIIGKIEENGQTYYYIIRYQAPKQEGTGSTTIYNIEKYNSTGQKIDTNNVFVSFDPSYGWNDSNGAFNNSSGTVISENPIEVTYTQDTNTPIAITIKGDGWQRQYTRAGVEIVDKNSKDDAPGGPNVDEIEEEKAAEESHYQEEEQEKADLKQEEIEKKIYEFEQERLADEEEKQQAIDAESSEQLEKLLSEPGVVDVDGEGRITIGGLVLNDDAQDAIEVQESLLYKLEFGIGLDQDDLPNVNHNRKESQIRDEAYDFVSDVFFYQPDATEPMRLAIGGKDVKLPYKLHAGKEFSQNLIKKGWLEDLYNRGKVYYIVTQAQDASYKKEGRTIEQDMDTFTVSLIVEDDNNKACYACSLRQLGKYLSLGEDRDPITGEVRLDKDKNPIMKEYFVDHEQQLRDKLGRIHTVYNIGRTRQQTYENERFGVAKTEYERLHGSRPQTPPENAPEEEWEKHKQETLAWENKVKNWISDSYKLPRIRGEREEQYQERVEQRKEALRRINERARYNLRQVGKQPLSDAKIAEAIDNLRKVRNEIINAYLQKDKNGFVWPDVNNINRNVRPTVVTRSNGRYNNKKTESGQPILQNVSRKDNPFGIKQDISDINSQINNGQLILGVGTGEVNSNDKNTIRDFREDHKSTTYDGKGLAGKVFIMVNGVNNTYVPVMLGEEKFNKQHVGSDIPEIIGSVNDNIKLCINPFTGDVVEPDNKIKPSAAEVLLYLMFNKLNKSLLPKNQEGSQLQFARFFVHVDEITLLSNSNVEAQLPYYAAKQLAMVNGNLIIGMPVIDSDGVPVADRFGRMQFRQKAYSETSLFGSDPQAEKNRLAVVRAIASQMHWNTETAAMEERFGESNTNLIAQELEEFFKDNTDEETFVLAGVPEFSFNKHDLFEVDDETGEILRIKKNMSMAAWMLHSGKLMSDVGETIFKDPFVFASGVQVTPTQKLKNEAKKADAVLNTRDVDLTKVVAKSTIILDDPTKYQRVGNQIGAANPNSPIAKAVFHNEQEYIDYMIDQERLANSESTKKHGPIVRVIALDLPTTADDRTITVEKLKEVVKNKIKDLKDNLDPNTIGSKQLYDDKDTYEDVLDTQYRQLMSPKTKWLLLARIQEDGHIKLWANRYVGANTRPPKGSINIINGVYQTTKTGGSFDEPYARKWLLDKLGLNEHQIFVTNALLRGTENEQVFGVTNISLDKLRKEVMGYMVLSTAAGVGIQFHEAFHYVNLLLHTKQQRMAIYREFVENHKSYRNKTFGEIEEALAEEFRKYMEGVEGVSISAKVKNFFRKLGDLLIASRRHTAYRQVFDAIHEGYYRNNQHMDAESINEFVKKYPEGVHHLRITGIPFHMTSDMKNIPTPHDFYQTADAIFDFILQRAEIRTPEDVFNLSGEKFESLLKQLKAYSEMLDEATGGMIMDFYNNPAVLQYAILNKFASLGIVSKKVRLDYREDLDNDAGAKEDAPDNIYDRFQFSISKKDSVMFRAKLFLMQIPVAHFVLTDDGKIFDETGKRPLEYVSNDILPDVYKYVRFDEIWGHIISETNKCVGYGVADENGVFPPNSFRGIVKRKARVDQFFAALDEKLDEIDDDFELKRQIYTAINSQKPKIAFYEMQAAKSVGSIMSEEDFESFTEEDIQELQRKARENSLADRMKQWVLRNDNTLQAVRNIPRRWSNSLLLSGIVDLHSEKQIISEQYTKILDEQVSAIKEEYDRVFGKKNIKKMSEDDFMQCYMNMSQMCITLCDYLGISMDQDVLDYFVNLKNQSESYKDKAAILRDTFTKTTSGTVGYTTRLLINNAGKDKLINRAGDATKQLKEPLEIDKIFSGTKLSSDISLLAMSYNAMYPNSSDFGIFGPNKEMIYPISQNNFQSAKLRNINLTGGKHALDMMKSPYARHSIIINTAKEFEENVSDDDQFQLNLEVGLKDATSQDGADFFGTTSLEDYIQMMLTLDQDPDFVPVNAKSGYSSNEATHLVSPTMADKKTHYNISSKSARFRTSHEPVIGFLREGMIWGADIKEFAQDMFGIEEPYMLGRDARMSMLNAWAKYNPNYKYRKLSNKTIERFVGYFLDELESLIQYYNKANISDVVKNPNKRISNFHGNVKGGMMDFSGNGGKFRYFYDTLPIDGKVVNLNHRLEWLFKLEKDILSSKKIKLKGYGDDVSAALRDIDPNAKSTKDFDGFELIRAELKRIKELCFEQNGRTAKQFLIDGINNKLFNMIDAEIYRTSVNPSLRLSEWIPSKGYFSPVAIPAQLLSRQNARFVANKRSGGSRSYIPYTNQDADATMFYSLMANHTVNSLTSIIEFEKVFSADPAQYKWKGVKGEYAVEKQKMSYTLPSGEVVETEYYVSNIGDKFSDKIKRLGSILSPGNEMALDLNESEKNDPELNPDGYLNSNHYTKLVVDDVISKSEILDSIIGPKFKNNLIADYIRHNDVPELTKYIENRAKKDSKYNKERLINDILDSNRVVFFDELDEFTDKVVARNLQDDLDEYGVDLSYYPISDEGLLQTKHAYKNSKPTVSEYVFNLLPQDVRQSINEKLKQKSKPYEGITVADAQIFMRPKLYRKIRMSLGMWTTVEDESGYSDELAYKILEEDSDWQRDPEKAAIVNKLELFPLKMSYVGNEPYSISRNTNTSRKSKTQNNNINLGTLDKAAYFPLFRFTASNEVGQKLYDRMNKEDNEIDIIAFVSAVKVGSPQQIPQLFEKNSVGSLRDVLDNDNDTRVIYNKDSETGEDIEYIGGNNKLPIQVQDLHLLRYQLNTKAHEATERGLGTQAGKLGFSNIVDTAMYGRNKKGQQPRSGARIKQDIMACIKALSEIEQEELEARYFKTVKQQRKVNDKEVHKLFEQVAKSQNLGPIAEEILQNGVAESLSSRKMFEQKLSALVGKKIIDINMNGGTAVQQSMIGFNDYDGSAVMSDEQLSNRNNLLSQEVESVFDFLKPADIKNLTKSGISTVEQFLNSNSKLLKTKDIKDRMKYLNLHKGDHTIEGYHKLNNGREIKWQASENSMQVILSLNFFRSIIPDEFNKTYESARKWLLDNNIIGDKAKPFGMGYRIPTQGMSSMFAFQVADVLPYTSGDVIIVPREFTAQTGSDFDVDKLFLATFAYEKGFLPVDKEGNIGERSTSRSEVRNVDGVKNAHSQKDLLSVYKNETKAAVQNQLLQDYIDVITDERNYGEARGSIDEVTNIVGEKLLSWLRPAQVSYVSGMYELLPSFQLEKKQEFKVGKDGISPFALHTTNLGMTQMVHLSLDYDAMGLGDYKFGHLDEIDGQDGIRIAAWLSAMINAHVDVAKDPYVFTLNVNKATYDYATFLLRAGKGISTFTFLTQPIIVEYANLFINGGGMYGKNITGKDTINKTRSQISNEIKKSLINKYINEAEYLLKQIPTEYKQEHKQMFNTINETITTTKYHHQYTKRQRDDYKKTHNNKPASYSFNKALIFDYKTAKEQIQNYRNPNNTVDKLKATVYQLLVLKAFDDIKPCSEALSSLVQLSQIDTKKYGNTIMSQINYLTRVNEFKYSNKTPWIITTDSLELNAEPSHALRKYYSETFLDTKLQAAIKYIKQLGSGELLCASKEFETIFTDIAAEINGSIELDIPNLYIDKKGRERVKSKSEDEKKSKWDVQTITTFKPFMKQDTVDALSQAINNLMRFNILINVGKFGVSGNALDRFEARRDRLLTSNNEDFDSYDYLEEGPIDFVYGGDYNKIVTNVMRLFYGDNNQPSLPMRVKRFISDVLNDPYGEDAVGIVENGKIINDFLLYLNPIPATKDISVDRLNLNESAIRTSKEKKEVLQAYWNDLLTHPSRRVRQLARDIAIYSYYTTYDTSTTNTITDIIPPYFRQYYDQAIASAVKQEGVKLEDVVTSFFGINGSNEIIKKQGIGQLYYDIIARNYWYDDDIVHRVHEMGNGQMDLRGSYIEYRSSYATDPKSNQKFPGIIISSNFGGHPLYVKMVKNNGSVLYRRVGRLYKLNKNKKDMLRPTYVYLAVQKAGMHTGKTHMFEFFKTQFIPSIFKQNMLPAEYDNQQIITDLVTNKIPSWNDAAKDGTYVFNPEDQLVIPVNNSETLNKFVYKEKPKQKNKSLFGGNMRVSLKKNPKQDAQDFSDLILKFISNDDQIDKESKYYNKTVYINVNDPFAISNIINRMQDLKLDKRAGRSIYMDINDRDFDVSAEDVNKQLQIIVDHYVDKYIQDNPYASDEQISQFEDDISNQMKDYASYTAKIQKMSTAANIALQTLITNDYRMTAMYASDLTLGTKAAVNAYNHNIDYFSTPLMSNLFVTKEAYKSDDYEQILSDIENEVEVQDLYVEDSAVADENSNIEQEWEQKDQAEDDAFSMFNADDDTEFDEESEKSKPEPKSEESDDPFADVNADDDEEFDEDIAQQRQQKQDEKDLQEEYKKPESPEDSINGAC